MLVVIEQRESPVFTSPPVHFNRGLFLFVLRLLIMVAAVGLKTPVTWARTRQQWVPQVYPEHSNSQQLNPPSSCLPGALHYRTDVNPKQIFNVSHLALMRAASKRPIAPSDGQTFLLIVHFLGLLPHGLQALLVSCVPGALKSPLDLQWHLTWDTCCRYDGRSMSLSAVRGW